MTGLCGNFNGNINDDSLTPSGDDNKNVTKFAAEWQTNAECQVTPHTNYHGACSHSTLFETFSKKQCSQLREGKKQILTINIITRFTGKSVQGKSKPMEGGTKLGFPLDCHK